jgi:hypothetical protein
MASILALATLRLAIVEISKTNNFKSQYGRIVKSRPIAVNESTSATRADS